jgi:hypothetical protein
MKSLKNEPVRFTMFVCPHLTIREQLNEFLQNLIVLGHYFPVTKQKMRGSVPQQL